MPQIIDIIVDGVKIDEVSDSIPVILNTDELCIDFLNKFYNQNHDNFTEEDKNLLDRALVFLNTDEDSAITFGGLDIMQLTNLADKFPSDANEILACCNHIHDCIQFEIKDAPDLDKFYLAGLNAECILSDLLLGSN